MGKAVLGTSGWSYDEWVGVFYPSKETNKLSYYSSVFGTAEIDSTFYSYPSKGLVFGLVRYTRPDFVFSAKLPKLITHEKRLDAGAGVEEDVQRFLELMKPLALEGKLGPVLMQLPPFLKKDLNLLRSFFRVLPTDTRFAIEFRHPSWWGEETWRLLEEFEVANTIVDEPLLPPDAVVTADFAYLRWHGRGTRPWYNYLYTPQELEAWVPKLREIESKTKVAYGYFNNHFHGYAVENCLAVLGMLGVLTQKQAEAKREIGSHFTSPPPVRRKRTERRLTEFVPPAPAEMSFEQLLGTFLDRGRLARAQEIGDDEISELSVTDRRIEAKIRDYAVLFDRNERVVYHDCADWAKGSLRGQFCKHLGKILLVIPRDRAISLLRDILNNKDEWRFRSAPEEERD